MNNGTMAPPVSNIIHAQRRKICIYVTWANLEDALARLNKPSYKFNYDIIPLVFFHLKEMSMTIK